MQEDGVNYILSKEQLEKVFQSSGTALWRYDRSILLMSAVSPIAIAAFNMIFYFTLLMYECRKSHAITYWIALAAFLVMYCVVRIRWDKINLEKYHENAKEVMLRELENAAIRHEIDMMVDPHE